MSSFVRPKNKKKGKERSRNWEKSCQERSTTEQKFEESKPLSLYRSNWALDNMVHGHHQYCIFLDSQWPERRSEEASPGLNP